MMKNLYLIAKEDLINLIKNPMWIFTVTAFPLLMIAFLGYLTNGNYSNLIDSYDYYGVTLLLYAVLNSGMLASNSFMEERIKKPNMRIIYAPSSAKFIYFSKIIASFIFSFGFHLLDMVFLSLVFHVHFGSFPQFILLLALTELFAVTLGIMCCCIFKTEAIANQILSIIINLISILGGLMFSLDGYGETVRRISLLSPAKWLSNTMFQMIYDHNSQSVFATALGLVVTTCVMIVVCNITFRKEDCIC